MSVIVGFNQITSPALELVKRHTYLVKYLYYKDEEIEDFGFAEPDTGILTTLKRALGLEKEKTPLDQGTIQQARLGFDFDGISIDKAAEGIEFLLTGKLEEGSDLGNIAFRGTTSLGDFDLGYGAPLLVEPQLVRKIAQEFEKISPEDLLKKYNKETWVSREIYPFDQGAEMDEGERKYLAGYYADLRKYYFDAEQKGNAILISYT